MNELIYQRKNVLAFMINCFFIDMCQKLGKVGQELGKKPGKPPANPLTPTFPSEAQRHKQWTVRQKYIHIYREIQKFRGTLAAQLYTVRNPGLMPLNKWIVIVNQFLFQTVYRFYNGTDKRTLQPKDSTGQKVDEVVD